MNSKKQLIVKNIESKKYYCNDCDKAFGESRGLKRHLLTHNKSKINREEQQKRLDKYFVKFPMDDGGKSFCIGCHKEVDINIDNWHIKKDKGLQQPCRECSRNKSDYRIRIKENKKKLETEKRLTIEQYIELDNKKYEPIYDSDDP